jgi:hypothetical protein
VHPKMVLDKTHRVFNGSVFRGAPTNSRGMPLSSASACFGRIVGHSYKRGKTRHKGRLCDPSAKNDAGRTPASEFIRPYRGVLSACHRVASQLAGALCRVAVAEEEQCAWMIYTEVGRDTFAELAIVHIAAPVPEISRAE